ncbi:MAG: CDP-alcohol phosphatidyltransferase family protein [Myxococcales bacterium]|nr:CDP-alcohol phosphatidyltransferase family protein [Myxococcales bacterium]MCB9578212.1 CDP-alcohol phosphatidyltransferase family protein [Polyangiaceae bacterium]
MGAIAEVYQQTRKRPDLFWNTYVCRPLAAVVVVAVRNTRVTPNQITLSALWVASAAAAMFVAVPGYWGLLLGAIVFELSYVLDCADGMLARLRGVQSQGGHLLDFLMDEIKAFILLAAVAVRLWREHGQVVYLLLGLGGLVVLSTGIAITTFQRRPEIAGPPPAAGAAARKKQSLLRRAVGLAEGVAKFLIHYPSYILYAAIAGHIELYFFPYIAVNAAYALKSVAWVSLKFGRS